MTDRNVHVSGRAIEDRTGRSLPHLGVRILAGSTTPLEEVGRDHTDRDGEFSVPFTYTARAFVFSVVLSDHHDREIYRTVPQQVGPEETEHHCEIVLGIDAVPRAPRVSVVRPARARPGDIVDLSGSGFGADGDEVRVTMGGREAIVLGVTPRHLIVRLPADDGPLDPLVICVRGLRTELSGLISPLPASTRHRATTGLDLGRPGVHRGMAWFS